MRDGGGGGRVGGGVRLMSVYCIIAECTEETSTVSSLSNLCKSLEGGREGERKGGREGGIIPPYTPVSLSHSNLESSGFMNGQL